MTPSEARDYVIRHCNPDYPHGKTEWETAINMAINALEKQMPKPLSHNGTVCGQPIYVCDRCGGTPGKGMFCRNCGQRIER